MLFDSHTHLNNESYDDESREELFKAIEASDVSYVMDVGFDLSSSAVAAKHAARFPWCYAAVGCHPHETDHFDETQISLLAQLARKPKVQAIGEIGLDFYKEYSTRENQLYWFRSQIELANSYRMPMIIHDRDAHEKVMTVLKEHGGFSDQRASWFPKRPGPEGEMLKDTRVLLHCYSGSKEQALQYIKLGATISIAGPVTYSNSKKLVEVVEEIPIEFLLAETDAPYLTPVPFRGKQNMSPYVEYTVRKIAEIKGIPYEEAARITCENAKRFFNIY